MTGYGPTSFHDFFSDDDLMSEVSSVGDLSPSGYPALRECTMADVQGQLPVPVEIEDTHTSPDPRAQALANAQVHYEDLRQRRQHRPLPASARLQHHCEPNARDATSGTRARARQVHQAIVAVANDPTQFARAGQNITAVAILLRNLSEPADPQ
jgi:hypothetical protein